MFINFSNHPSEKWDKIQRREAEKYGNIVDIPFPPVLAEEGEEYIEQLADQSVERIFEIENPPKAVMVQGEFNLAFAVARRLLDKNIKVLSACTGRNVTEKTDSSGNPVKESKFVFTRFREYRL